MIDDFYRAADVFVFPSYREPGGNVVFEAMSFGLPLVVGDRGGPGSAVDERSGIRVPPRVTGPVRRRPRRRDHDAWSTIPRHGPRWARRHVPESRGSRCGTRRSSSR